MLVKINIRVVWLHVLVSAGLPERLVVSCPHKLCSAMTIIATVDSGVYIYSTLLWYNHYT